MIDNLVRHKYPEEKPELEGMYLVRTLYESGILDGKKYMIASFSNASWDGKKWEVWHKDVVTHWWNLPEVKE